MDKVTITGGHIVEFIEDFSEDEKRAILQAATDRAAIFLDPVFFRANRGKTGFYFTGDEEETPFN